MYIYIYMHIYIYAYRPIYVRSVALFAYMEELIFLRFLAAAT